MVAVSATYVPQAGHWTFIFTSLLADPLIRDLAFLNAAELLMAQQRVKPIAVNEFLEDVKPTTGKNFPAGIRGNGTVVQSVSEFVGEVHAQL
jgi:hypothetical protein